MVTFFLELVVRAVLCRMGCSYTVLVKCNYTYGLYQLANLPVKDVDHCAICLSPYNEDDRDLVVTDCLGKHVFHEECIIGWCEVQCLCPVCRADLKFIVN
eukprot:TRINITY_DN5766_c0_g1_i2.p1 TRINITY_DN5766_c0_g1~~TRINITY_DN5766_c0_g1_i2.p1  ORF type:complete len:109 (-),score=12.67 TRINITY_DN5766_c0_g1_i2:118-417(-)